MTNCLCLSVCLCLSQLFSQLAEKADLFSGSNQKKQVRFVHISLVFSRSYWPLMFFLESSAVVGACFVVWKGPHAVWLDRPGAGRRPKCWGLMVTEPPPDWASLRGCSSPFAETAALLWVAWTSSLKPSHSSTFCVLGRHEIATRLPYFVAGERLTIEKEHRLTWDS